MRKGIRHASSRFVALSTTERHAEPCSCLGSGRCCSRWARTVDGQPYQGRPCVPPATDTSAKIAQRNTRQVARWLVSLAISQNQLNFLKVFTMRQTEVAAPPFAPVLAPTFMAAAIRFVASLAALIGVSLLLASL